MRTIYFKESKNLESIQGIGLIKSKTEDIKRAVIFDNSTYEIIDELPDNQKEFGYVEVSEKENKKLKVKLEDIKASIDNRVAIEKNQKNRKIIGYIEIDNNGSLDYIALVKEKLVIIPFILLGILIALLLGLWLIPKDNTDIKEPVKEPVVFKDGDKGTGDLGKEAIEFGEQPTFRMKLNCTPTVEDGYMNLRLESPAEDNEGLGFVVKVYLLQKIENGEVVESYDGDPKQIYESPIIYANENIENCVLDTEVESGRYVARAVYNIYDMENNFIGQVAGRLDIKAN